MMQYSTTAAVSSSPPDHFDMADTWTRSSCRSAVGLRTLTLNPPGTAACTAFCSVTKPSGASPLATMTSISALTLRAISSAWDVTSSKLIVRKDLFAHSPKLGCMTEV